MRAVRAVTCAAALGAALAAPGTAIAHGVQGRADLPVPITMFYQAAAGILVASFVLLAALWSRPLLERHAAWSRELRFARPLVGRGALAIGRALTLALLVLVLATALFGSSDPTRNPAPTIVFVLWWVGIAPLSVTFGDVWRAVNPWATIARLLRVDGAGAVHGAGGAPVRGARGGLWVAAGFLLAFTWLELAYPTAAHVRLLGVATLAYTVFTVGAMARVGVEAWLDRGEAFAVYTGLLARLSPWTRADGRAPAWRWPVVGALAVPAAPALTVFTTMLIGTVSYDGLSRTGWWMVRTGNAVQRLMLDGGLSAQAARTLIGTVALVTMCALAWGAFELACLGAARLGRLGAPGGGGRVADAFAPTLLPIAFAYVVAHYFSFFVFQVQDLVRLLDDPFGTGATLLGTGDFTIDYSLMGANAIWYVQVGAIVVGHVLGLVLAHDRAMALAPDRRRAVRSQWCMLALMVLYTVGGLYFLSEGMTG